MIWIRNHLVFPGFRYALNLNRLTRRLYHMIRPTTSEMNIYFSKFS